MKPSQTEALTFDPKTMKQNMNTNDKTETKHDRHRCPSCSAKLHRSSVDESLVCGQCEAKCAGSELSAKRHDYFWNAKAQSWEKNTRASLFDTPDDAPEPASLAEIGEGKLEQLQKIWRPNERR